ncbi:hypothetical protein [Pseudostreptobacillus hongkongensis]|uniref:hypothetical protein n=1 Tax=Pseudostreptobacillus hongkongensis TaxID=1162717 RepID=UPI00082A38BC|nr:hypothetical protein [Pseudostreptobacillus hongkongensis]
MYINKDEELEKYYNYKLKQEKNEQETKELKFEKLEAAISLLKIEILTLREKVDSLHLSTSK